MRVPRKAYPPILGPEWSNSRLFFRLLFGLRVRSFGGLLELLEQDEVADLLARLVGEILELGHQGPSLPLRRGLGLSEELAHLQVEDLEDLEERVQADLVLSLFHAREIGL